MTLLRSQALACKTPMTEPRALAVLAHPDDETFRCGGTLALLALRGVGVHLLTATRGEAGSCGEPPLCMPEELPALREQELRCACSSGVNTFAGPKRGSDMTFFWI